MPIGAKIVLVHKCNEDQAMINIESAPQAKHIESFIGASKEYFGLSCAKFQTKDQNSISAVTSMHKRNHMISYRKVIQSILIAAGIGAFAAGPAMADHGCGHMGGHAEQHVKMMEQHHAQLHDALKLTAEQEPAWKKLMDSEQPRPALSGGQPEDWAKLNAPERAEKMLELSKARQVQMTEHVTALKALYAVLSPEQQKTFEDFHAAHQGRMSGKPGKASSADKAPGKP
jgi:Spy/CpxP family protein refolding chaperone